MPRQPLMRLVPCLLLSQPLLGVPTTRICSQKARWPEACLDIPTGAETRVGESIQKQQNLARGPWRTSRGKRLENGGSSIDAGASRGIVDTVRVCEDGGLGGRRHRVLPSKRLGHYGVSGGSGGWVEACPGEAVVLVDERSEDGLLTGHSEDRRMLHGWPAPS